MNFINLLLDEQASSSSWQNFILIGIFLVAIIFFMFWNGRSNKKRQAKEEARMNALGPGNKVRTVGGICGIVVEVDREDGTFVMETGTAENKSYVKLLLQAIAESDVVIPDEPKKGKEAPAEETPVEEASVEEADPSAEETVTKINGEPKE